MLKSTFHRHQLLHLAFEHSRNRNAGPLGDDFRDVLFVDFFLQHHAVLLKHSKLVLLGSEALFEFRNLAVLNFRRAAEFAGVARLIELQLQLLEFGFRFAHVLDGFFLRLPFRLHARRRFFKVRDALFDLSQVALSTSRLLRAEVPAARSRAE